MNRHQLEKTFEAPIVVGPARRAGRRWFQFKARHLWCPACFRVFPNGVHRRVAGLRLCPYGDCATAEAAARPWDEIRAQRPAYPLHPWFAVRYPSRLSTVAAGPAAAPAS